MNINEQGRESVPSILRGLTAWTLWVLASAVGGAAGGTTFVLGAFGLLFLFGPIIGAAQAVVLRHYLPKGTAIRWVLVSFLGWFAGLVTVAATVGILGEGVQDAVAQKTGSETPLLLTLMVLAWAVLGAAQAIFLLRRLSSARFLAGLWAVAGVVGGAAAQAIIFYLPTAFPGLASAEAGGGLLRQIASGAVGVGAGASVGPGGVFAGAIYGAATGVVLAMIARRSAVQENSPSVDASEDQ